MEKSIVVIGLGAFGISLCKRLVVQGAEVIAVDNDRSRATFLDEESVRIIHADAREKESLAAAGIADVDAGVVAIGEDIESSLIATLQLKELGIPEVYARTVSPAHREILLRIGVPPDHILRVEEDAGERLANHLTERDLQELLPLDESYSVSEIPIPEAVIGKSLQELDLRAKYEINVVGIRRVIRIVDEDGAVTGRLSFVLPSASTELQKSDRIIIVGHRRGIEQFLSL